jgi:hydrogenase expression/formation protein HypD
MGDIPDSGLGLAGGYADFDAERRFGAVATSEDAVGECISGLVLRGERKPPECAAFGVRCTPERPLGVTMVSSEGACAAYFRYRGVTAAVGGTR